MMHGLRPGPELFTDYLHVTYGVFLALLVGLRFPVSPHPSHALSFSHPSPRSFEDPRGQASFLVRTGTGCIFPFRFRFDSPLPSGWKGMAFPIAREG